MKRTHILAAGAAALAIPAPAFGVPPLELLFGAQFKGPAMVDASSKAAAFSGRTTLASGSATVVVSTTLVGSDSLVLYGTVGNANVSSGTGIRHIEVKTLAPGSRIVFGTNDGVAIPRDTVIHWFMLRGS